MYHSNSRSASPGVGAHKPFTPGANGHGIPNENLRLDGGACARSGPREGKKRKKPPPQAGDRQANLTVCAKSHCHGGRLSCEPAPGAAEKGLAHPRGIAQRGKCPLFFLLERRNKRVWWVRRTNDRARSAQRSSVHACLGGVGGCLGPPAGPGRAINALLGKRHHEVEKRGHLGARVSTWRRGLLALVLSMGGVK